MDICNRTFELAKAHLAGLDYRGPVALACDDTKLFATLRLFWDKKEDSYFLIGACGGPIRVPDVDAAQEVLADPNVKKATKVCYIRSHLTAMMTPICSDPAMVYDNPCRWGCANPPRCSPNLREREAWNTFTAPQEGPPWVDRGEDPSRLLFLRWH